VLRAPLPGGGEANVVLGRRFALDAELAETMRNLPGLISAQLSADNAAAPAEQRPRLAAVS
jgi:DNA polymerase-3 subunit alpha